MAAIQITDCRGMSKKIDPKKLPEGIAQAAYNVQFGQGHISPIKQPSTPSPAINMDLNSLSSGTNRIFKTSNDLWISFDHYASIMESPVPEDSFKRIYSTGHTESGQTVARGFAMVNLRQTCRISYLNSGCQSPVRAYRNGHNNK